MSRSSWEEEQRQRLAEQRRRDRTAATILWTIAILTWALGAYAFWHLLPR